MKCLQKCSVALLAATLAALLVGALAWGIDGEAEDPLEESVDAGMPAAVGSTIKFEISQKVSTLSVNCITRYESMSFVDYLPDEVEFVDAKVFGRGDADVTAQAGTMSYDPSQHVARYAFSNSWLQSSMPMAGETYVFTVWAQVIAIPDSGKILNKGSCSINNLIMETNETETEVIQAELAITKNSTEEVVTPSLDGYAEIGFTSEITQTVPDAAAKSVTVTDIMPPELDFICGSLEAHDEYGSAIELEIEESPEGFTAVFDRLDYEQTAELDFKCSITEEALGNTVVNTIEASALSVAAVRASSRAVVVYDTVTPRIVNITKKIPASDLKDDHGDAIFMFVLEGTDVDGEHRTYRGVATLNRSSDVDSDGFAIAECSLDGIAAGNYTIRELMPSRYSFVSLESIDENVAIEAEQAIAEMVAHSGASCTFTNQKTSWSQLSDATCITNSFPGGAR